MKVKIRFESEAYIDGDTIEEIKEKWENLNLLSEEAIVEYDGDFVEVKEAINVETYEFVDGF